MPLSLPSWLWHYLQSSSGHLCPHLQDSGADNNNTAALTAEARATAAAMAVWCAQTTIDNQLKATAEETVVVAVTAAAVVVMADGDLDCNGKGSGSNSGDSGGNGTNSNNNCGSSGDGNRCDSCNISATAAATWWQ